MAHVYTEESNFENIANAIREKNGKSNTYLPSEMASAIEEINTTLQEKTLEIDHNGTYEITPTDDAYGLSKVKVSTNIDATFINLYIEKLTLGLDRAIADGCLTEEEKQQIIEFFTERGGGSDYHYWDDNFVSISNNSNIEGKFGVVVYKYDPPYANGIDINADVIIHSYNYIISNTYTLTTPCICCVCRNIRFGQYGTSPFIGNGTMEKILGNLVLDSSFNNFQTFFAYTNFPQLPNFIFSNNTIIYFDSFVALNKKIKEVKNLPYINGTMSLCFAGCGNLESIEINAKPTTIGRAFINNYKVKTIKTIDLSACYAASHFLQTFMGCKMLESCILNNWKSGNIGFNDSPNLLPSTVHHIIENAMTMEQGATLRTLTLHATAKANFKASFESEDDYNAYLAEITESKDITIA